MSWRNYKEVFREMSKTEIILKCAKCQHELPDKYRYGRTHGSKCPKCKEGLMYITSKEIEIMERKQ